MNMGQARIRKAKGLPSRTHKGNTNGVPQISFYLVGSETTKERVEEFFTDLFTDNINTQEQCEKLEALNTLLRDDYAKYPIESMVDVFEVASFHVWTESIDSDGKSVTFDNASYVPGRCKGVLDTVSVVGPVICDAGWNATDTISFARLWYNDAELREAKGKIYYWVKSEQSLDFFIRFDPREGHSGKPLSRIGMLVRDHTNSNPIRVIPNINEMTATRH